MDARGLVARTENQDTPNKALLGHTIAMNAVKDRPRWVHGGSKLKRWAQKLAVSSWVDVL